METETKYFKKIFDLIKYYRDVCWYVSSFLDFSILKEIPNNIDLMIYSDYYIKEQKIGQLNNKIIESSGCDEIIFSEQLHSDKYMDFCKKNIPSCFMPENIECFFFKVKINDRIIHILFFLCENLYLLRHFIKPFEVSLNYLLVKNDGCREGGNYYCCNDYKSDFFNEVMNYPFRPKFWITDHKDEDFQKNFDYKYSSIKHSYGRGYNSFANDGCIQYIIPSESFKFKYSKGKNISIKPYTINKVEYEKLHTYTYNNKKLLIYYEDIENWHLKNVSFDFVFMYGRFFFDIKQKTKEFKINDKLFFLKEQKNTKVIQIPSKERFSYDTKLDCLEELAEYFKAQTVAVMPIDSNNDSRYIKFLISKKTFPSEIHYFYNSDYLADFPHIYENNKEILEAENIKYNGIEIVEKIIDSEYKINDYNIEFSEREDYW